MFSFSRPLVFRLLACVFSSPACVGASASLIDSKIDSRLFLSPSLRLIFFIIHSLVITIPSSLYSIPNLWSDVMPANMAASVAL
jgi:hypothetical protein